MSQRRASISAGHGSASWAARNAFKRRLHAPETIPVESPAPVAVEPAPLERVVHPTITPTRSSWYRVVRLYQSRDHGVCLEDIGEFPTFPEAAAFARTERGRARVLEPWTKSNGKIVADNLQPIESRA